MFKSHHSNFRPSPAGKVIEKRFTPQTSDNGTVVVESEVDLTSDNPLLPTREEYTLQNLIEAGVRLDVVPSTVLTPTDVETVNSALNSALESINSKNDSE